MNANPVPLQPTLTVSETRERDSQTDPFTPVVPCGVGRPVGGVPVIRGVFSIRNLLPAVESATLSSIPPATRHLIEVLEARIAPAFGAVFELSTLNGSNGFKLSGEAEYDYSGHASAAGDVNGDGFEDVIVAANVEYSRSDDAGASYVVFGKPGGFPEDFQLSTLDGRNGFKLNGLAKSDFFPGRSASVGDVNGDGFADLVIGAPGDDTNGANAGAAYIIFGHAGAFPSVLEVSDLDGSNGFQVYGKAANDSLGSAISTAGDVNGDGFADVVIGASGADLGSRGSAGESYVIFGHRGAFAATFDLSRLDGSNGFRIKGEAAYNSVGIDVSTGDVNGDGFDDLLIGALAPFFRTISIGTINVVFGHSGTFPHTIKLSQLDGVVGLRISSPPSDYNYVAVSSGDFNGDGFDDVFMGAGGFYHGGAYDSHGPPAAAIYVIWGRAQAFPPAIRIADNHGRIDHSYGFQISGRDFILSNLVSVDGSGDFNGDGFDDVLIGNRNAPPGGAAYLVFGAAGTSHRNVSLSKLNGHNGFKLVGDGQFTGSSVSTGDFDHDGFADLLIGAPADGFQSSGASYVVFGPVTLDSKTARFTDVDGDRITLTTSRGTFEPSDFKILAVPGAVVGGGQFAELDVSRNEIHRNEFAGAAITIIARPTALGGDGKVNLGYLNATGVDLGRFSLEGDLGRVDAGDRNLASPAIRGLRVHSVGAEGITTQDPATASLNSIFQGDLKKLRVTESVLGGVTLAVGGRIGVAVIGGNLDQSSITALGASKKGQTVAIESLTIGGDVAASRILAGYNPAGIATNADASIGKVRVSGSWTASDLVAGVVDSTGDGFGQNDALIAFDTSPEILARIARITIAGSATGTSAADDYFGITAQQIRRVVVGNTKPAVAAGPDDLLLDPVHGDFRLVDFA